MFSYLKYIVKIGCRWPVKYNAHCFDVSSVQGAFHNNVRLKHGIPVHYKRQHKAAVAIIQEMQFVSMTSFNYRHLTLNIFLFKLR